MLRILVDAMGGDNAPQEIVKGAMRAKSELGLDITLVGQKEAILACLDGSEKEAVRIVDAREVITMEDDPSTATRRKKDSSMAVALRMLKDGEGDAVVSAGSTGALLTGATLTVKRIHGIRRAALAPVLPAGEHGVMLIDCGANVECTAEYLLQFAFMGSFYAKKLMNIPNPRIGLLNVGTEDTKGGELQHQAFALLKKAHDEGRIRFVGNVEGTGVFTGEADVVVTDGFTGNVMLKTTEGTIKYIMKALRRNRTGRNLEAGDQGPRLFQCGQLFRRNPAGKAVCRIGLYRRYRGEHRLYETQNGVRQNRAATGRENRISVSESEAPGDGADPQLLCQRAPAGAPGVL